MALLEGKGLGLARAGRAVVAGFDISSGEARRLAIVTDNGEAAQALALMFAGLSPRHAGILRLEGVAYPVEKKQLARFRAGRIGFLGPQSGEAEFAAAIAGKPKLLVCLEPAEELAGATHRQMTAAIVARSEAAGIGLLIVTQEIRLAADMAQSAWVLAGGRAVESGPARELADRPRHEATRRLVAATRPRTRTMARPPVGEPLLTVEGVTKRLGGWWRGPAEPALEGIELTVRRGEALGVIGEAGAGKSVLLRLMAGLTRPSRGRLALERASYRDGPPPGIGMLFPDAHAAFNPDLPVGLTLTEPMRVDEHLLADERANRLVDAVRAVGLMPDLLDQLPSAFSPAQLQRLALARALVGRPRLLLLDEPTRRLGPVERAEFLTLFARVRSDYGLTVVFASRHFDVLRLVADRLAVLDRGRLVEGGSPAGLYQDGTHPATRRLVAPAYGEAPPPMPPDAASAGRADESAESGKLEHAAAGSGNGTGRIDAADGKASR